MNDINSLRSRALGNEFTRRSAAQAAIHPGEKMKNENSETPVKDGFNKLLRPLALKKDSSRTIADRLGDALLMAKSARCSAERRAATNALIAAMDAALADVKTKIAFLEKTNTSGVLH